MENRPDISPCIIIFFLKNGCKDTVIHLIKQYLLLGKRQYLITILIYMQREINFYSYFCILKC